MQLQRENNRLSAAVAKLKLTVAAKEAVDDMNEQLQLGPVERIQSTGPLEEMPTFDLSQAASTAGNGTGREDGGKIQMDWQFETQDQALTCVHQKQMNDLEKKLKAADERSAIVRRISIQ
jgi:hypothetical protein